MEDNTWWITLVSTLTGSIVTYIATYFIERGKERRAMKRSNMTEILIPLCSDVEEVIGAINEIDHIEEVDSKQMERLLSAPCHFLNAAQRIFLNDEQRDDLSQYNEARNHFELTWQEESQELLFQYEDWIVRQIKEFSYLFGEYDDIHIGLDIGYSDLYSMILKQDAYSIIDHVQIICLADSAEGANADKIKEYSVDKGVKQMYFSLMNNEISSDTLTNDEKKQIEIYTVLSEIDDREFIRDYISKTMARKALERVKNKAILLQEDLINYIDRIAG